MNNRTLWAVALAFVVAAAGCHRVGAAGDAGADADTDSDTDIDADADADSDADSDTDTDADTETTTDPEILACIEEYGWPCECQGACEDGFGYTVLYPADAGEFPFDTWPSEELLAAGVAWHYCSICDTCDEWHRVKIDGEWIDQGVYDFCAFIAEYDAACGGCLVESSGGGG